MYTRIIIYNHVYMYTYIYIYIYIRQCEPESLEPAVPSKRASRQSAQTECVNYFLTTDV